MVLEAHLTCYTAYGHASPTLGSFTGFNSEYMLKPPEHYALGAGRRLYSPSLMRFISADSLSPFGNGGSNAYAYCAGDPVNRIDPTGQSWLSPLKGLANRLGLRTPSSQRRESPPSYESTFQRLAEPTRNKLKALDEKIFTAESKFLESGPASENHRLEKIRKLYKERSQIWNDNAYQPWPDDALTQHMPPTYKQLFPNKPKKDTRPPTTSQAIVHTVRAAQ